MFKETCNTSMKSILKNNWSQRTCSQTLVKIQIKELGNRETSNAVSTVQ